MLFLPETYRKERSIAYQKALKRAKKLAAANAEKPDQIYTFKTTFDNRSSKFTEFPTKAGETESDTVQRAAMAVDKPVRVSFSDVNPFKTIGKILKQKHNFFAILSSAILFASQCESSIDFGGAELTGLL